MVGPLLIILRAVALRLRPAEEEGVEIDAKGDDLSIPLELAWLAGQNIISELIAAAGK